LNKGFDTEMNSDTGWNSNTGWNSGAGMSFVTERIPVAEKRAGGIGSVSLALIFAVLCMTVFATLSMRSSLAGKALTDAQESAVKAYYAADGCAERIMSEILDAPAVPEAIDGIKITSERGAGGEIISFSCPVTDRRELAVEAAVFDAYYEIRRWQTRDTSEWVKDDSIPVWTGERSTDGGAPVWTGGE
jgi:hypothetical protein